MTDKSTRLIAVVLAAMAIGGVAITGVAVADQHTAGQDETDDGQQSSYLRLVHATADAPAVDVMVNNETVVSNLEYGNVTDYQRLPAGNHTVTIVAADDPSQVFFEGAVYLEARTASTLAAAPPATATGDAVQPVMFIDNAWEPDANSSALSAVHLVSNAPAVDVTIPAEGMAEGNVTAGGAENGTVMDNATATEEPLVGNETEAGNDTALGNETEAGNETMIGNETATAEALVGNETEAGNETMAGNETETDVGLDENETATPTEAMAGENATGENLIVVADNLTYRSASDYVTVPAGEHTVQIRAATATNDGEILATVNVSVEGGTAHSALALSSVTMNETMAGNETVVDNETVAGNETATEEPLVGNETEAGNDTALGNETAAGNETMIGNETATEEALVGNETEAGNETMAGNETVAGNETMAGNETEAGLAENATETDDEAMAGENATGDAGEVSLMVELTDDVTYTLNLPSEQPDDGEVTMNETETEEPLVGNETEAGNETMAGNETDVGLDENETEAGNGTGLGNETAPGNATAAGNATGDDEAGA